MRNAAIRHHGTCPTCGKHKYASRRDAKRAARYLHPQDSMRAYQCGAFYHYGHVPTWMARGEAR